MSPYKSIIRPLLFQLWRDPERAHEGTLRFIPFIAKCYSLFRKFHPRPSTPLSVNIAGLEFGSPIGLAAGFDKDAVCFQHMYAFGFGSVEVGTLTPLPQKGNDGQRIQRLAEHNAIINRMGFPNQGIADAIPRLRAFKQRAGPLGVNVGANKDSADRIQDYLDGYRDVAGVADYVTINVSSPNTPGLRDLESGEGLKRLVDKLDCEVEKLGVPIFLKVSPDLDHSQIHEISQILLTSKISALIVGNTTTDRPTEMDNAEGLIQGGLSGVPLKLKSLGALRKFHSEIGHAIPIISVGGISTAEDVMERVLAGASLVQLYTGFIYEGPFSIDRMNFGLFRLLRESGIRSVAAATGSDGKVKRTQASHPSTLDSEVSGIAKATVAA